MNDSKIDLIISHPIHLIFPLWMQFIHDNRERFNKVIVIFTFMNAGSGDYRKYVSDALSKDNVACIDNDEVLAKDDWRNIAINKALKYSNSEWVWFTEEDFTPMGNFWAEIEDFMKRVDVFGYYQDARLHPCCIFIKRKILEHTSKNFGVIEDEADHFSRIQRNLESKDIIIGVIPSYLGEHMNGLSQNMYMLQLGQEPNYQPERFKEYCRQCLLLDNLHPDFSKLFSEYLNKHE